MTGKQKVLGIVAVLLVVSVWLQESRGQEFIDPIVLEAWGELEQPTEAEREAGLQWRDAGDTWLLVLPAPRLGWYCDDPLGCIQIVGSSEPFCVMRVRSELPEFIEEAKIEDLRAQCGTVLNVAARD